ncbi:hypothetical protein ABZX92_37880 [Lentzea sp. NPDC006480]|uniref:hypothetical protein n=1 Tax=Lentzea sp. NPDC006480 TaxID=3157176 RepID=UPI0033ABB32B
MFHGFVAELLGVIDDDPELTAALRKLLEAKAAAVRAARWAAPMAASSRDSRR